MSAPERYFMDDQREPDRLAEKVNGRQWVSTYLTPILADEITVLDVPVNSAKTRYPDKRKRREKN